MVLKKFSLNPKALTRPVLLVALMWLGFLLQYTGLVSTCQGALIPLVPEGLKGVLFAPFLHGNLEHLTSNSLPIAVLVFLLYQFYPTLAWKVLATGWIAAGLLIWSIPPIALFSQDSLTSCIVGASGIVYVLAFFLFFSGVIRKERHLMAISLVVGFYYGSLIWGIFPEEFFYRLEEPSRISWQSHLSGALVGTTLAFVFRKRGSKRKRYIWEFPNYYNEKDDMLWQEFKANSPELYQEMPQKKEDSIWKRLDKIRREDSE